MRDVLDGEDTVKAQGTIYLPQPNGMSTSEYEAYKTRAAYTNFTARAHSAMCGLVGRKKPGLVAPEEILALAPDITMTGDSLDSFSMDCLSETLATGRAGILVDYPVAPEEPLAIRDLELYGMRPYFILFKAEDILDWREGRVGNRRVLTFVKLREYFEQPMGGSNSGSASYNTTLEERIRVLRLDEEGYCVFEVYAPVIEPGSESTQAFLSVDTGPTTRDYIYQNGERISYIPFVFLGPLKNSPEIQRPPLLDMAYLNIHHYQASADRNHAVHWADVPTPVFIGQLAAETDGSPATSVRLGPTSAINITSENGDAKFLEMSGNGINPTKELMEEYVQAMSTLGNKILAGDARATEAAETAAIHRSGEQAILAAMANNISIGITEALKIIADYLDIEEDLEEEAEGIATISYKLPTNYLPGSIESQTIIALIGALQSNQLSSEEFYDALVQGGLIRSDKTFEEHVEEIKDPAIPIVVEETTGSSTSSVTKVDSDSGGEFGVPVAGVDNATNPV